MKRRGFTSMNRGSSHLLGNVDSLAGLRHRTGFTLIELMVSIALLAIALTSITVVYITTERIRDTGVESLDVEFSGIQEKAEAPEEFISRIVRLASWSGVEDSGDRIYVAIPQDSTKEDILQVSFSFEEYGFEGEELGEKLGSIFYDPDTSSSGDEIEMYTNVYKIEEEDGIQPVFSIDEDLVTVYFGYFKGDIAVEENRRKVEFNIKMRNV